MIMLLGESAGGKTKTQEALVKLYGYKKLITYTTRPPRAGEVNHEDYHFITNDEFERLIKEGFFAEYQLYKDIWYYGTAKEDCTNDKILVATPHALRMFKNRSDLNITSIYIKVDRRSRLISILERGDDIDEAYRRNLHDDGQFIGLDDEVDYVILNTKYKYSAEQVGNIVHKLACMRALGYKYNNPYEKYIK